MTVDDHLDSGEFPALNSDGVAVWEALANWWQEATGEADEFHRRLVIPATDRLLALQPGERVLDAACGNGAYARHLAAQGAEVVAFDGSRRLIELAEEQSRAYRQRLSFRHIDAADGRALRTLGQGTYDAAVCKMALMDMAVIQPLLLALTELLKPGGRFVFSVLHPAFNSTGTSLCLEGYTTDAGEWRIQPAVKVTRYLRPEARKGVAKDDQPQPQYYFHRPIGLLLSAGFRVGFVLDGIEEPAFAGASEGPPTLNWARFQDIPPVLVVRLRLPRTLGSSETH